MKKRKKTKVSICPFLEMIVVVVCRSGDVDLPRVHWKGDTGQGDKRHGREWGGLESGCSSPEGSS